MLKTFFNSSTLAAISLLSMVAGCNSASKRGCSISFDKTPPAVRSAFLAYYTTDSTVQKTLREVKGGQDYYTFTYKDKGGETHEAELNEGGDQVNWH